MKKQLVVISALVCLLAVAAVAPAEALELGNPAALTPKGQFDLGVSASYLFEQKVKDYDLGMRYSYGGSESSQCGGRLEDDQYYLLSLTYGLTDWLNVFGQAGLAHGGKMISLGLTSPTEWETKLKDEFVWAVGAKARAFQLDNGLALGLAARYLRYDNRKLSPWRENISGYEDTSEWIDDGKIDYWQVDLAAVLSLPLGPVTPYAGVGYAYSEAKETQRSANIHSPYSVDYDATIKNKDQLLALCGLDVALGKGFSLYLQAEFVARTTLGLGLIWSF